MMKQFLILILLFASCNIVSFGAGQHEGKESLQVLIDNSLEAALKKRAAEPLTKVDKTLSSKKGNVWVYWQAYLQMCKSVYYASEKQDSEAKINLECGINLLDKEQNKTTEDYALLGYMQSQFIRYTKGMESGMLSAKAKRNASKAVELDSINIRGWVVLGIIDFYTPKQYGGKEKCESYLLKAISLPSQSIENQYRPSWGKMEAYSLLLAYYNENGKNDKVRQYYKIAIKEFPNEPSLKKYENY
ncbi:MAG: hypothetical protein SPJ90_09855 [Prevotella sp.]|nr:hypothetical protein [Prevotellaceae bacterium]MDY5844704.1 hypothetical protein [Prevotella sp.]